MQRIVRPRIFSCSSIKKNSAKNVLTNWPHIVLIFLMIESLYLEYCFQIHKWFIRGILFYFLSMHLLFSSAYAIFQYKQICLN